MSSTTAKKVVIVGGGFGGVRLAHRLAGNPHTSVTLVSDRDYFAYYPQLYHSATGGSRSESALPLTDLFKGTRVVVMIDALVDFDAEQQTITTAARQTLSYDYLVLALGNVTNYFGIEGMEEYSYGIKTIASAEKFKQHLHKELIELKRPEANYVVVGAGPTGVELAAALGGYLERILRLHGIKTPHYNIDLVEAAPRVLPRSSEKVSARVKAQLEKVGVHVMTGETVEGESATMLKLKGETIKTQTVVWTAGVSNHPFYKQHAGQFTLSPKGRVVVDTHLLASPHVYVLGDNAETVYSGLAQTAVHDANFVAADIMRRLQHRTRPDYKPKRPISVIPVGPRWAAVEWGNLRLYGLLGWFLRRAADLIAYHDIEQWPKAIKVWLQEFRHDDDCPVCAKANS